MRPILSFIKNITTFFRDLVLKRKLYFILTILTIILVIIIAFRSKNTYIFTNFTYNEYSNLYNYDINKESFTKDLLTGISTIFFTLIIIFLFSLNKWLSFFNIFLVFIKAYTLTQTFISFSKLLNSVNALCVIIILLPIELLLLFNMIACILISLDIPNCKNNGGLNKIIKVYIAFSLIMIIIYFISLILIKIMCNVILTNFIWFFITFLKYTAYNFYNISKDKIKEILWKKYINI